jgi:hypothetical protein
MKKTELKSLIKECIKEVLFQEEGILSTIIAEVAIGITKAQGLMVESQLEKPSVQKTDTSILCEENESRRKKLLETKRKMLDAIGRPSMKNVFEGTEPLPASSQSQASSPLSGRSPNDAGVDISNLFGLAGSKWKHLK